MNRRRVILCFVFLVAVLARVTFLGLIPRGLFTDEASFLVNTKAILMTGKDEDNRSFPLFFESYQDPKPALYSYIQAPFVALLGVTTEASRYPSAILGVCSLVLLYAIFKRLLTPSHALLSLGLLAISPWHIMVSRATQEVIVAFVCSLVAILIFLMISEQKKRSTTSLVVHVAALFVSCFVAMYLYHSAKVFLPLLLLGWGVFFLKNQQGFEKISKKNILIAIGIPVVALVTTFLVFSNGLTRFKDVGFLRNQYPQLILEEETRTGTNIVPAILLRVFYNKVTANGQYILQVYLQHFSAGFLFFSDGQPLRYLIPFQGQLYLIEIALIPLGIVLGFINKKTRGWSALMLMWLLIAPIPAALTYQEVPSIIRAFPMVVPLLVFSAFAVQTLWQNRKQLSSKLMLIAVLLGYLWGISYFVMQLTVQQPLYHSHNRNRADERLAQKLTEVADKYDQINLYITNNIYTFISIRNPELIPLLQTSYPARKMPAFTLNKYHFFATTCNPTLVDPDKKVLYVVENGCQEEPSFAVVDHVSYDNDEQTYKLMEYVKKP